MRFHNYGIFVVFIRYVHHITLRAMHYSREFKTRIYICPNVSAIDYHRYLTNQSAEENPLKKEIDYNVRS